MLMSNVPASGGSIAKTNLRKASTLIFEMLDTPRLVPLKYRKKLIFELRPIVLAVKKQDNLLLRHNLRHNLLISF